MVCEVEEDLFIIKFTLPAADNYNSREYNAVSWQKLMNSDPSSIIIQCRHKDTKCRDESVHVVINYNRVFDSVTNGTDLLSERVEHEFEYQEMFWAYLKYN